MKAERMKDLLIKGAFLIGCALLLYFAGRYMIGWFLPFLLGFLIAFVLRWPAKFISKHSGMSRRSSSIVCAVLFYGLLGALIWTLGAYLIWRVRELGGWLPELYETSVKPMLQTISARIEEITGGRTVAGPIGSGAAGALGAANDALAGAVSTVSQRGLEILGNFAGALPMTAIGTVFTIVSSAFICADYEKIRKAAVRLIPSKHREHVLEARDYLRGTIGKAAKAYFILMAITFAGLLIGLWLLGINRFWIPAVITAILDFLPIIGSGAVLLPWAGYLLLTGQTGTGLGMIALWVIVSILREALEPRVLGGQIGLHPLAAVTAMYAGLKIAGVWGLILAPIVCLLVRHLYERGHIPVGKNTQ